MSKAKRQGDSPKIQLNEWGLNEQQEKFCQLWALDFDFHGNGAMSYAEAYDVDRTAKNWYKNAVASGSRLLRNVKVYKRCNMLLETMDLNDVNVDKQLSHVIGQNADLKAKMQGIKEYNTLKKRTSALGDIHLKISLTELLNAADKDKEGASEDNSRV